MNDTNHLLTILAEKLGLPDLAWNADGVAEIILGDGHSIYLTRIEEPVLELSVRLDTLDYADPPLLSAMMEANFLGAGTGFGRLAGDPSNGTTVFCERWHAGQMDAGAVEQRFAGFTQYGVYWLTEGGEMLRDEADRRRAQAADVPAGSAPEEEEVRIPL